MTYRPLCMLDSCSGLFEKIIIRRLRTHIDSVIQIPSNKSTINSLSCLRSIVEMANGQEYVRNLYVEVLTLEVKNAFNSVLWTKIIDALRRKNVSDCSRIGNKSG